MLGKIKNGLISTVNWIKNVDPWFFAVVGVALAAFTAIITSMTMDGSLYSGHGALANIFSSFVLSFGCTGLVFLVVALIATEIMDERAKEKVQANRVHSDACSQALGRIRSVILGLRAKVTPAVQAQLDSIVDKCGKIHQAIVLDGKEIVANQFLEQYLKPTEAWLSVYSRLKSRNIGSAASMIEQSEAITLPLLAGKLDIFYDQLHVNDIALLSTADVAIELAQKAEIGLPAEAILA